MYEHKNRLHPTYPYTIPQPEPMSPEAIQAGLKAVVKAMNNGLMSEEHGNYLMRVLATAYVSDFVSQNIGAFIEEGLSSVFRQGLEGLNAGGRR